MIRARYSTAFGSFVHNTTVPRVAAMTFVSDRCVYHWLAGRAVPSAETCLTLIRASGGALRLEDIVEHRLQVERARIELP